MSFFNGLAGNIKGFAVSTAKQAGSNLISNILSRASATMSGGAGASYAGLPPELANAKTILELAMRIRYAQGWQWNIEVDGYPELDMFVKDITFGFGNIETESTQIGSVEFNKPTLASAGTVTVTVRDTEARDVRNWFMARKQRVTNPDGTLNLPREYLLNIRIYSVTQDGEQILTDTAEVFPTQFGEVSYARDMLTEFSYYPLTFVRYTSAGTGIGSLASSAAGSLVSGSINSAISSAASELSSLF